MVDTINNVRPKIARAHENAPSESNTDSEARNTADDFEGIFRAHWTRVCAVLYRLVGDQDEAEDLALEVFWRLYRRSMKAGKPENLGGWLYRVTVNLGYNALRSYKRRTQYEEQAGHLLLDHQPDLNTAQAAEQAEDREQVRKVLAKMKPRDAQLLILRHSGYSYSEIAIALELSPGSVGTLLARAEKDFEKRFLALERR